ncbi:MAG: hypothetical protein WAP51_03580 [Candidatus Sungiibacteriota bacterium]
MKNHLSFLKSNHFAVLLRSVIISAFAVAVIASAQPGPPGGIPGQPPVVSGWTDDGTVVRLTTSTDSVGIGTANPIAKLSVIGNISVAGDISSVVNIVASGLATFANGLVVNGGAVNLPAGQIDNVELANSSVVVNAGGGLVGGGTAPLGGSVSIDIASDPTLNVSADSIGINLSNANNWSGVQTFSGGANFPGTGIWDSAGNIGIGTVSPQARLDVVGNIRIADGTEGAGKVLTSDATGFASWQISSGGAGGWTDAGPVVHLTTNTDKVGIGTENPTESLHLSKSGDAAIRFESSGASVLTTATFNYIGAIQTWIVPAGVTSITVDARGAQGGGGAGDLGASGGFGGRVQTIIPVTPGETLYISVGGINGFNGGGTGSNAPYGGGGRGGGASDIRRGGNTLSHRVVVAGGGGGGGSGASSSSNTAGGGGGGGGYYGGGGGGVTSGFIPGGEGGAGGGLIGGSGVSVSGCSGGGGGTQTSGGTAGGPRGYYGSPSEGSLGNGGHGGGESAGHGCGGGGGSSLVPAGGTTTNGFHSGHGQIIISYQVPVISNWAAGIDQDDGRLKISEGVGIGTDDRFIIDDDSDNIAIKGGIILKAINGANCYRVTVNNTGALQTTLIPCL